MKMLPKLITSTISALIVSACFGNYVLAAAVEQDIHSADIRTDVKEVRWTALASRYANPYFAESAGAALSPALLSSWWAILEDETLTVLIESSLSNNKDLQAARARVNEARAALGVSKATLLPWLDSNSSWTRTKISDNAPTESGLANSYKLSLDASWEIDIFGRERQKVRAAAADLQAEHAQLYSTWVSLSSEVAINYLSLRTFQQRLSIAENNVALQEETVELLQAKYDAGLIDELPLSQAKYTVSQTKSTIPTIKTNIAATINRLAILTGRLPGSLEELLQKQKELPDINSMLYVGIPAEALRQRPDIHAAERQLAAQIARSKSAKADLRPRFSLFGSIGLESVSSGSIFAGGSKGFSVGPQLTLPIFHAGAIRKNIKVQTAREEQYLAVYEQTVLNAVAEVRDALVAATQENERNQSLKEGMEAAAIALTVASDKYNNGLTDFQNVIDAQRALLSLEDQYATSQGQKISNLVHLFKVLGGGWEPLAQEGAALANTR